MRLSPTADTLFVSAVSLLASLASLSNCTMHHAPLCGPDLAAHTVPLPMDSRHTYVKPDWLHGEPPWLTQTLASTL
jgi:hypothetical protein